MRMSFFLKVGLSLVRSRDLLLFFFPSLLQVSLSLLYYFTVSSYLLAILVPHEPFEELKSDPFQTHSIQYNVTRRIPHQQIWQR